MILVTEQLPVFFPSDVAYAHTQRAALSGARPFPSPLLPPVALLQPHLLCIHPVLFETAHLCRQARGQGLHEEGRGFGFGHFIKEGEVGDVFPRGGQGDHGRELVSPEYLIWKVGGSNLAGGGGRLHRGAHDYQELKVSQLRVCPAATWRQEHFGYNEPFFQSKSCVGLIDSQQ